MIVITRILFVWPYWQFPEVALEFVQNVSLKNHDVSILLASGKSCGTQRFRIFCVPAYDVFSKVTKTPYPLLKNPSSYIKSINPDIVHINSHLFLSNYQVVSACKSLSIPSVLTVHGLSAKRNFVLDLLQSVYLRTLGRLFFMKASAVICLTRHDATVVFSLIGNKSKIFLVPNGVDTNLFKASSTKDPFLISWIGRFVPEKGLIYLLKAMPSVVAKYPSVRLLLGGDGPLKSQLVKCVGDLGLEKNVVFLGMLDRKGVAEVLSESSIFVFPSLQEGMPFSPLEAMSAENAVVASDIPGVSAFIKNSYNGLLVPPKNVAELSSAMLELLGDSCLRDRLSKNGRDTVEKRYSTESMLTKLEGVYNTLH